MPEWLAVGFSATGLSVAIIQQIPGIIWAIRPPEDDPFSRNSGSALVEVAEKLFGVASLLLIVVVLARFDVPSTLAMASLVASFGVLGVYYAFYVLYYRGRTGPVVLLGMALFPPLAFALVACSQGNWPALATSAVFGTIHVGLTYSNLIAGSAAAPDAG